MKDHEIDKHKIRILLYLLASIQHILINRLHGPSPECGYRK